MVSDTDLFKALTAMIQRRVPTFRHIWKPRSFVHILLALLAFAFNPTYLTGYITTLRRTVAWTRPDPENSPTSWWTLAHEYVHLSDSLRLTYPLYVFLYFFPNSVLVLAPLALLAIWFTKWWLLCLLFLGLAAVPWPRTGRGMYFELRGYTMTLAVQYWTTGTFGDTLDGVVRQFTGSDYYWMWRDEKTVRAAFAQQMAKLRDKTIFDGTAGAPFRDVYDELKRQGAVVL